MMKKVANTDEYIANNPHWQEELLTLRKILRSTEAEETIKWSAPAYTINGKIVMGMMAFKKYFGLWFHQGALLKDKHKKLVNAQEGTTQAMRQWRFKSYDEIDQKLVKEYMEEAIANQKAGKTIKARKNKPLEMPAELKTALSKNKKANEQFEALTLSKKREYTEHIATAKREETKQKRLQKILPMIESGIGLHDKYR